MTPPDPSITRILLRVAPVIGGVAVLAWRIRETRAPVTARGILLPPLAMSTGFLMFVAPPMRVPWSWTAAAFLTGYFLLSIPLLRTSELTRRDGEVLMERSNGFLVILLGLFGLRLALHEYVEHVITPLQTAAVFFVLAFGMILRWRSAMYLRYRALTQPS